jgi:RimJ/RimL family protein N-acetyltransferase
MREAVASALPTPRKKVERPRRKLGTAISFIDLILEIDKKAPCKRRHPESSMTEHLSISFRPLNLTDFPLLQEWLSAPHVAAWWHERLDLAGVHARYGPRVGGADPTHVFVIEQCNRPIGWIQWYLWSDYPEHALQLGAELSSAGIDLAIGELPLTGKGLGEVAIREFLKQIVFANPRVIAVTTDPEEGNFKSLRAFKKAGFTVTNTVQLAGESFKRRVVRMHRFLPSK